MRKFQILLLMICLLTGCSSTMIIHPTKVPVEGEFRITVLKAGQADAIVLHTLTHTVLIDCGEQDDGDDLVAYLQNQGVKHIDYLFITHFDKDHVGGVPEVLDNYSVDHIMVPDYIGTGSKYLKYQNYLFEHQLHDEVVGETMSLILDDVALCVYPPMESSYKAGDNDFSLVISVVHGENSFLFAGDAEKQRLMELEKQMDLQHTFLKIPHHGRCNSYTEEFLSLVKPKYAVVTCSEKNPAESQLFEFLSSIGCKSFTTAEADFMIHCDGKQIYINDGRK